jgi:hypothetical protein
MSITKTRVACDVRSSYVHVKCILHSLYVLVLSEWLPTGDWRPASQSVGVYQVSSQRDDARDSLPSPSDLADLFGDARLTLHSADLLSSVPIIRTDQPQNMVLLLLLLPLSQPQSLTRLK